MSRTQRSEGSAGSTAGRSAAGKMKATTVTDDIAPVPPARLTGSSDHSRIANEIGLRIVRGDHPPGSILPNEARWAEIFSVSRSAVREATKMLMAKSLLTSRPKVGSRVEPRERWNLLDRDVLAWYAASPHREQFLRTVQEFRYIVEPEAAALAA